MRGDWYPVRFIYDGLLYLVWRRGDSKPIYFSWSRLALFGFQLPNCSNAPFVLVKRAETGISFYFITLSRRSSIPIISATCLRLSGRRLAAIFVLPLIPLVDCNLI